MSNNLGTSSFVNLFPEFVYDKHQVAEKSLDIWNAFRIKILNKRDNETSFLYHEIRSEDTITSLSQRYYGDQTFWWIVLLSNESEDPFTFLQSARDSADGKVAIIKILKPEFLGGIMYDITNTREFTQSIYNKSGESS